MHRRNKKRSINPPATQLVDASPWPVQAVVLALIVIVVFVEYWAALRGGRLLDDNVNITAPELRSLGGLYRLWFEPGTTLQYYPVLDTLFWLEHRLWGDALLGYHLANVAWHLMAALLVFAVLTKLNVPGALLAAAIFAVHPVIIESVAWISEQKNTVSTVFYLSAMLAYLYFDQSRRWGWYAAAFALFVLALGSKTATVTLPVTLLVIFWWQRGVISLRRDIAPLVPFFALATASGLMTIWVERNFNGAAGAEFAITLPERTLLAGRAVWFYLAKLFWPGELMFIYPRWTLDAANAWQWLFPLAAVAVIVVLWLLRSRTRAPLAAWLIYCVTLFPTLGFFNVSFFIYSFVADHFQYLASIAAIALAAAAITMCGRWLPTTLRWLVPVCSAMLVGVLVVVGMRHAKIYASDIALYEATLRGNPDSWRTHHILAGSLRAGNRPTEAIDHYQQAIRLNPNFSESRNDLGNALLATGRVPEAIAEFRAALAIKPDNPHVHSNLGNALLTAGRPAEAIEEFKSTLAVNPGDATAASSVAVCLIQMGQLPEAISKLERVVEDHPEDADAYGKLGIALSAAGDMPRAIEHFRRAAQIDSESVRAQNNLATSLLRSGNIEEAITHYEQAVALQPSFVSAHRSLGEAYRKSSQPEKAIEHYRAALRLQPDDFRVLQNLVQTLASLGRSAEAVTEAKQGIEAARHNNQPAAADQLEDWLKHYQIELERDRSAAASQSESPAK